MKKLLILIPLLLLLGCDAAKAARDTIATDYGWITTAQAQHRESCQADTAQQKCALINRAIAVHNTSVDLLNLYCQGAPKPDDVPYDEGGPCSPQKGLEPRLRAAIRDLDTIVKDVKGWVR